MGLPLNKTASVWIKGAITQDTFLEFVGQLNSVGSYSQIDVNIYTNGGLLSIGKAIMEFLQAKKKQGVVIRTIAWGQCASAGTLIFLSADAENRELSPSCAFCIHEVMNGGDLYGAKAEDLIWLGNDIEKDNQWLANLYAEKTGNNIDVIRGWMKEDLNWDSETTIKRGFASKLTSQTLNQAFTVLERICEYNPKEGINASEIKELNNEELFVYLSIIENGKA